MKPPTFTNINHIGIVTADIERAVHTWADRYGIGPWRFFRYDKVNMQATLDGEAAMFSFRVALANLSTTSRIEIIQPLDGAGPYAVSLARHGGNDHIHHVRFDVSDFDATFARLRDGAGASATMKAEFAGKTGSEAVFRCAFLSTEADLGFVAEIGQAGAGFAMLEPEGIYPPQA